MGKFGEIDSADTRDGMFLLSFLLFACTKEHPRMAQLGFLFSVYLCHKLSICNPTLLPPVIHHLTIVPGVGVAY